MANSKMLAIVAVAVVVIVVAAGCVVMLNNDDDDKKYTAQTRLLTYGNANNDNFLDESDKDFINDILEGKTTWDKEKNPLADAYPDGQITTKDIEVLDNFLKGKPETMYYKNYYGETRSVPFPLSGKVAGTMVQTLDLALIVGFYDDVVAIKDLPADIAKYNSTFYPGAAQKIKSVRAEGANAYDVDELAAQNIDIVIGDPDKGLTEDMIAKIHAAMPKTVCLELPLNRVVNNLDVTYTAVTLGVMMNKQDITEKYINYLGEVEHVINEKLAALGEQADTKTFTLAYRLGETSSTQTNIDSVGTGAVQYGDVANMQKLPLKSKINSGLPDGYIKNYNLDDLITANPDIIFVETWNMISSDMSEKEYREILEYRVGLIKASEAYKHNQVITLSFEIYGSIPAMAGLLAVAGLIWPDLVDYEDGLDYLNQYYRSFTNAGKHFDVREHLGYAPLVWGKDIQN